jgi:hypothetical protein
MACVDETDGEAPRPEDFVDGNPIDARGLERHGRDPTRDEPRREAVRITTTRGVTSDPFVTPRTTQGYRALPTHQCRDGLSARTRPHPTARAARRNEPPSVSRPMSRSVSCVDRKAGLYRHARFQSFEWGAVRAIDVESFLFEGKAVRGENTKRPERDRRSDLLPVRVDQKSSCAPNFTSRASKVDVGRCHVAPLVP